MSRISNRELFPLPLIAVSDSASGSSRHAQQRRARNTQVVRRANEVVESLNFLHGKAAAGDGVRCSASQRRALDHITSCCREDVPPDGLGPPEAILSELLGAKSFGSVYNTGSCVPRVASFDASLISLPSSAGGVSLSEALPVELRSSVVELSSLLTPLALSSLSLSPPLL
jgi:hypothetical protein